MELEIPPPPPPPFSVFLGTSMRATFHIKFSDRGSALSECSCYLLTSHFMEETIYILGDYMGKVPWDFLNGLWRPHIHLVISSWRPLKS